MKPLFIFSTILNMQTFLIALFVLLMITAIMAVGVLFGRKPIAGSCGGVGAALGEEDYVCELCGNDEAKCEELKSEGTVKGDGNYYDAGDKP